MNADEAKDEVLRLTSPLNSVCHIMKIMADNDTAYVTADSEPVRGIDGWRKGTVRFTIRVHDGHKPASFVRKLLEKYTTAECHFSGMTLIHSEHRSARESSLTYDAEFTWST